MGPKRKHTEDPEGEQATLIYASDVAWLRCLTHKSEEQIVCKVVKEDDANENLILGACKLVYILYHNVLEPGYLNSIVQSLNRSQAKSNADLTKLAKSQQSAWKRQILNMYFLPHVQKLKRKWRVARPYASFESLPEPDRIKIWMEVYDADPMGTVAAMYKPIVNVLDLSRIFNTDLILEDDQGKMQAIRVMFRRKYWYGCECTYRHRVAADRQEKVVEHKDKSFDAWVKYTKIGNNASSIVPFADLPVSTKALDGAPSRGAEKRAKKRVKKTERRAVSDDEFESLSTSSTQDFSDFTTLVSEKQVLKELPHTPQSLSLSRTPSIAGSITAVKECEASRERVDIPAKLSHSPAPSVATSSQEKKKPRRLRDLLGTPLWLSQTASEDASSSAPVESEPEDEWAI